MVFSLNLGRTAAYRWRVGCATWMFTLPIQERTGVWCVHTNKLHTNKKPSHSISKTTPIDTRALRTNCIHIHYNTIPNIHTVC